MDSTQQYESVVEMSVTHAQLVAVHFEHGPQGRTST